MRTPPDWARMTRDELEGHAAALWRAADTWLGGVELGMVVPATSLIVLNEWGARVSELREALK
jgi:hypothetical protein